LDKAPDAFRTISEVADELDVPQHVLRFWETRFAQIKPMKRSGGRRFYRPDDVDLLRGIRRLLYAEGYTIRGVQRILKEQGIKAVQGIDAAPRVEPEAPAAVAPNAKKKPARAVLPPSEPDEDEGEDIEAEAVAADEPAEDEGDDETLIVVSPPLPKPFTTPLPSLELRRSSTPIGMVPRSAMPPEVERPPKIPPVAPPPSYLPDITFDTSMPVPRRVAQSAAAPAASAGPPPQVVEPEPVRPATPAPLDSRRLQPVLDELMAVRRLLDAAMQGDP
jgi:DNA-binding transcriptional MerR regulator